MIYGYKKDRYLYIKETHSEWERDMDTNDLMWHREQETQELKPTKKEILY